jgi:hypothetical protein
MLMGKSIIDYKPIETSYQGYRFRSRLEARWAVFFDAMGIQWRYETEGYEKYIYREDEKGNEVVARVSRYLPDFYLPEFQCHVEVKGDPLGVYKERERLCDVLDWGSPIPYFTGSGDDDWKGPHFHGLLVLGDIPRQHWGFSFHGLIRHRKGLHREWFCFEMHKQCRLRLASDQDVQWIQHITGDQTISSCTSLDEWSLSDDWKFQAIQVPLRLASPVVMAAYDSARQARFEHGESNANSRRLSA